MSLEKLISLVPPPEVPKRAGTPEQWRDVERALGAALPEDYKRLVNTYGVGFFADWIYVASPFSSKYPFAQPGLLQMMKQGQAEFPEYHHPFPVWPEAGGLLPWGGDDNAGLFCWLTRGSPDQWITVNLDNDYSAAYREIPASVTDLLAGWLEGSIVGDWYPEDVLPTQERTFRKVAE